MVIISKGLSRLRTVLIGVFLVVLLGAGSVSADQDSRTSQNFFNNSRPKDVFNVFRPRSAAPTLPKGTSVVEVAEKKPKSAPADEKNAATSEKSSTEEAGKSASETAEAEPRKPEPKSDTFSASPEKEAPSDLAKRARAPVDPREERPILPPDQTPDSAVDPHAPSSFRAMVDGRAR